MRMTKWFVPIIALSVIYGCSQSAEQATQEEEAPATEEVVNEVVEKAPLNGLTSKEKEEGWMMLFDGETSNGWRNYGKETFPEGWVIADGMIHCPGSGKGEAGGADRGDIIYGDKKFSNFHVKLEWKLSEGGNSGIFYLGQEDPELSHIWKTAPEMQVLDNINHPDAKKGKDGNRQAGSLYDLYPATPQNAKPVGEWNAIEIIHDNGKVQHIQNGEVVVAYEIGTDKWKEDVAESKFPNLNENWVNIAKEGYFGLQDHGDDVWFRNIKIKEL